jgi:hypothetical protein
MKTLMPKIKDSYYAPNSTARKSDAFPGSAKQAEN